MKNQSQGENGLPKPVLKKVGITLVVLSCILYSAILLVPFTPYTLGTKTIITTILIVLGEASFWLGGFILGREIIMKYRKYLNPLNWFKKKNSDN